MPETNTGKALFAKRMASPPFQSVLRVFAILCLLGAFPFAVAANAGVASARPDVESLISVDNSESQRQGVENDPGIYLQLIEGMQNKSLYFASLAHLDAFDRRWPNNPRASLLRANAMREAGYLDKALALYQGLLQGALSGSAYHGLGMIAAKKGDMPAALSALLRANQLDPISAPILNDLGYIQLLNRQMDDASFSLHKATELDSKNTRTGANLALLYLLENKPERAEGVMNWYKFPEQHRKEIHDRARGLFSVPKKGDPGDAQPPAVIHKYEKSEENQQSPAGLVQK